MEIGYIGLGAMGGALARRLLADHSLTVWDIDPEAVAGLTQAGAATAATIAELGRKCDIVLLCLPRSADVQRVVFGEDGLAEGLSAGAIVIDQTSGVPAETRAIADRLAELGITLFDAPVAGGVPAAKAGTVRIIVSAPDAVFEQAAGVLRAISPNVLRCGRRVGDAQAIKTVNNAMNAGYRLATLEIVAMGRKAGLSLETMTDVLNAGSGRNFSTRGMMPAMIAGASWSDFLLPLMLKDLNQAVAMGQDADVPMPITQLVRGLLQIGVNTLGASSRLEQVIDLIESMASTRIAAPTERAVDGAPTIAGGDTRVGYVGLGTMGAALARRLMLSRPVEVYDIRRDVVSTLAAEGAQAANDLPSLAKACNVIVLCLPTSADVHDVLFGPEGLGKDLSPGTIIVDQTTGDPAQTRQIAARLRAEGVELVDAPVSGGPRGAVAGTIAIMAGGSAQAFALVRPILEAISPNVVHCGETGNGHAAKLVNNAVAACNRLITYECAAVGYRNGLSLADMATVINAGSGWSSASERILPVLASGGKTADFQLKLMVKDLKLAAGMGVSFGAPMLIANTVLSLFEAGAHMYQGTSNLDAMAGFYETVSGLSFAG